jgi:hypothetical protein
MSFTFFVLLGMQSEGNAQKNGGPAVGFSFTTMLQHTGPFSPKDFLSKNNVRTLEYPPNSPDLTPANFTCSLD